MIKEVNLINWKSHENSRIIFTKGINLIIGKIGSGKSSILDAISFSLFSNFPDLNSKRIKLEDVIMKKPLEKKFCEIVLRFEIENKEYEVKRRIEKERGSYSELKEGNKVIEIGTERVNSLIKKILKIDYDTFYNVIYGEQNRIDFLFTLQKGQRKERFDEMLGIEVLERIRRTSVSVKNKLLKIFTQKKAIFESFEKERIEEKLEKEKSEYFEFLRKKEKIKEEVEILENEIDKIEKEVEEGKKIRDKILDLKSKKEVLINDIIKLKVELKNLEEYKRLDKREIENKISEKEKLLNSFKEEIGNLKDEIDKISKQINDFEYFIKKQNEIEEEIRVLEEEKNKCFEEVKIKSEVISKIEKLKIEIEEIIKKSANIKSNIEFYEDVLKNLEKVENRCPLCGREIDKENKKKIQEKCLKILDELKSELKINNILKNEKEKELKSLEEKLLKIQRIEEKIKIIEKRIEELKSKVIKVDKSKLEELKNERNKLEIREKEIYSGMENLMKEILELNKILEKIERIEKIETEITKKEYDLSEIEKNLNVLNSNQFFLKLEENEKILKKKRDEYISKKTMLNEMIEKISILEKLIIEYEKKVQEKKKLKNEIEKIERYVRDFEILEKSVKETQAIVRKKLIDAINHYLSIYWNELYPYKDYESFRVYPTEDDYVFELKDSLGRWIEIEKVASGGERMIAALCLRIALAKVLAPQIDILILDEPTHNLDENSVKELTRTLNEKLSNFFSQIFVITHDERFEDLLAANIIRVERDKIRDLPTKIIQ
jgi:exonuclease SbcC